LIKAGVEKFALKSMNLLFLFGIRTKYRRSGRNLLLSLSVRRVIKQNVLIIEA